MTNTHAPETNHTQALYRHFIVIIAAIIVGSAASMVQAQQRNFRPLAFTRVSVIDVEKGLTLPDMTVIVTGNKISAVEKHGKVRLPRNARIIDARGKFLIPGLWDSHAHLTYAGDCALPVLVSYGITSVRDLGGRLSELRAWQQQIADGKLIGPRIKVAGSNIESEQWLARATKLLASIEELKHYRPFEFSPRLSVGNTEQAKTVVETLATQKVDVIKFRNLGGENFRIIAKEAQKYNIPLVGHAPTSVSIAEAAEAGMASIEHGETISNMLGSLSEKERSEQFFRVARNGTMITPTLIADYKSKLSTEAEMRKAAGADSTYPTDPGQVYVTKSLREMWKFAYDTRRFNGEKDWKAFFRKSATDLRLAHRAGVSMLVGTDLVVTLVYPGLSVHEEMALMKREIGMNNAEVLRAATINPARFFKTEQSLGTIERGKTADLVLLDANPLSDIQNTQKIQAVILGGKFYDRKQLDKILEKVKINIGRQINCVGIK